MSYESKAICFCQCHVWIFALLYYFKTQLFILFYIYINFSIKSPFLAVKKTNPIQSCEQIKTPAFCIQQFASIGITTCKLLYAIRHWNPAPFLWGVVTQVLQASWQEWFDFHAFWSYEGAELGGYQKRPGSLIAFTHIVTFSPPSWWMTKEACLQRKRTEH